jgi:hypothetical protein
LFGHGRLEWVPELLFFAVPARRAVHLRWTYRF